MIIKDFDRQPTQKIATIKKDIYAHIEFLNEFLDYESTIQTYTKLMAEVFRKFLMDKTGRNVRMEIGESTVSIVDKSNS